MIDPSVLARLKRDYHAGEPFHRMALVFGLGETQIKQFAKEGKWTRPDVATPAPAPVPEPAPKAKPVAAKGDAWHGEIKARARAHFGAGCSVSCVATRVGVPLPTVRRWVAEEVWTRTPPASTVEALLSLPPEQLAQRIAELLQAEQDLRILRAAHVAQTEALVQVRDDYLADDRARMRERAAYEATIAELQEKARAWPAAIVAACDSLDGRSA